MSISEFIYTVLLKPRFLKATTNWIIKRIIPEKIRIDGASIHLNPNDPVISGALSLKVYERDEIAFFKKYFQAEMTFLDVGANVGLYSALALSTHNFSGQIICMEPHDESRSYLKKTIAENIHSLPENKVIISDMAASSYTGVATLHKNSQNKGDNRLYSDELLDESEKISVTTIDEICSSHKIEHLNFLKIDIQGAEAKAISGASNILKKSKDCILLSELWPYGMSQFDSNAQDYLTELQILGFSLFELGKKSSITPININEIVKTYTGRKYTNIVGFKGIYLDQLDAW